MEEIREGNIGLRESQFNGRWEIVKWESNQEYHKYGEYSWDEANQVFVSKENPNFRVSPEYLDMREFCYTLAYLDDEKNCVSVGARPFVLDDTDWLALKKIVSQFYKTIE